MTERLSRKITVLSFISIVLVVLLHTNFIHYIDPGLNRNIQDFITAEITRIAVPLFFFLSGSLFLYNYNNDGFISFYKAKLKKRTKTLLIPFLLWSFIAFFLFNFLSLTIGKDFDFSLKKYFINLFSSPVGAYQLWFIRDLMIMVIITPLLFVLLRNKYLTAFFFSIIIYLWCIGHSNNIIAVESILFYSLGCYISLYYRDFFNITINSASIVGILFIVWIIVCLISFHYGVYAIHCLGIILGLMVLSGIYDILIGSKKLSDKLVNIFTLSFFIFLVHEPTLTIIKTLCIKTLFRLGDIGIALSYILSWIATIAICIILGFIFRKHLPSFYKLLTGNR